MWVRICATAWLVLAGTALACAADSGGHRIADPRVNGKPVDHCADIEAAPDCTARGEAKAALNACIANGYRKEVADHWRPASGTAMHFVTEYDMHAGEVGGRWVEQPTKGTFDWIACEK